MGEITRTFFLIAGCVFVMVPALWEFRGLAQILSLAGYNIFLLVFWNDAKKRREFTWVMLALMVFSAFLGLSVWHRIFRVGFWIGTLTSEVKVGIRKRFWWLEMVAFFVWGLSLVCVVSSWHWWVGLFDALGWLVLAGILVLCGRVLRKEAV
ncbi:hypothetical protein [Thermospira aquatica]|uniref:Uncharacterized protein n=1 Tax=Thermospira aquatica TaxID=2828656 RepID=A0AAX3BCV2_9SPIR|nr:hypothetical protein [Thermospira aquatica]URA10001.1 hypothetical protein KDW03_11045 [Thermospira aquatica]